MWPKRRRDAASIAASMPDPISGELPAGRRRGRRGTITGLALTAALVTAFALTISTGPSGRGAQGRHGHGTTAAELRAAAEVRLALGTTTGAGNFDFSYTLSPLTEPTTTPTTTCVTQPLPSGVEGSTSATTIPSLPCTNQVDRGIVIKGSGTITPSPYGLYADSHVYGGVIIYAGDTSLWWSEGSDAPSSSPETAVDTTVLDPPISPSTIGGPTTLSQFSGTVLGALGNRQGALAMLDIAGPTGYLDLEQSEVTSADQIGTATVDGVSVNQYRVHITPQQQGSLPGLSAEQSTTINDALSVLSDNGYTGESVVVSVDPSGFVRQTDTSAEFSDGSVARTVTDFSNFGCAGTVVMPGAPGSTAPPAGCMSPDTGKSIAATTTTTTPDTTTTTTADTTTTTQSSTTSTTSTSSTSTTTALASAGTTTSTSSTLHP